MHVIHTLYPQLKPTWPYAVSRNSGAVSRRSLSFQGVRKIIANLQCSFTTVVKSGESFLTPHYPGISGMELRRIWIEVSVSDVQWLSLLHFFFSLQLFQGMVPWALEICLWLLPDWFFALQAHFQMSWLIVISVFMFLIDTVAFVSIEELENVSPSQCPKRLLSI